jgi:hypothetical protein
MIFHKISSVCFCDFNENQVTDSINGVVLLIIFLTNLEIIQESLKEVSSKTCFISPISV